MPTVHREPGTTYEVDAHVELTALTGLLDAGTRATVAVRAGGVPVVEGEVRSHRLRATYLDTVDLRLAAAGVTLRRLTGGPDAGWHLEVAAADGARSQVRLPPGRGSGTVPQPLRQLVRVLVRGAALAPVARTDTRRSVRTLVDATGQVVLELADDRVDAVRLARTAGADEVRTATSWRRIRLLDGEKELLDAADENLRARGLRVLAHGSDVARALDLHPGPAPASPPSTTAATSSSAGQVLLDHLTELIAQVRTQDLPVRLDLPDGVHRMRVATRRLRSALTSFSPLLDPARVRPVRGELRWLATELGAARDAEVLRDRLRLAVRGEGEQVLAESVPATVAAELDLRYRQAHEGVLQALDGERYRRLLKALDALVEEPPVTSRAAGRAGKVLPVLIARSWRRLRRLVEAADAAPAGHQRQELLHEARKAAKRARYAGEAVTPAFGTPAAAFARAMEDVQEALGEHQDSVVTRERLRELARRTSSPAAAFTYGRLHAAEELRAGDAERQFESAWSKARRRSTRRWLR